MNGKQIIIADKQDITRLGLSTLAKGLHGGDEVVEVKKALCVEDIIVFLNDNAKAVVVLDIASFSADEYEELQHVFGSFQQTMWVLFCQDFSEEMIRKYCNNEHFSMVQKDDSANEIATALRYAFAGVRYISQHVTKILISLRPRQSLLERDNLTATEIEILRRLAFGKSVKEIAAERNSSIHTIATHKKNLYRKINVNTTYEATKYALRAGLVNMDEYV